jgi:predicted esterase
VIIHTIKTETYGHFLVEPAPHDHAPLLVGFHGYGESADAMMTQLQALAPTDDWCLVSVQALHRFYTRTQDVVASWMTRQDRELEIASNTSYVWMVVETVRREYRAARPLVFVGFSQGVAMAYRAAAMGDCNGLVVLAGDVPPDVHPRASTLPQILIGRGAQDEWYTAEKAAADHAALSVAGASVKEHVSPTGHEWDASFIDAAKKFIRTL